MDANTVTLIVAILALVSSLGAPLVNNLINRRRARAEEQKLSQETEKVSEEAAKADADASVTYMSAAKASAELYREEQNENREMREALKTALSQIDALNKDMMTRNLVIMEHDRRFHDYDLQMDLLRSQVLTLQQEKSALEGRVKKLEAEKAQLERDNERMRFQMSETQAKLDRYQKWVNELEQQVEVAKKSKGEKV